MIVSCTFFFGSLFSPTMFYISALLLLPDHSSLHLTGSNKSKDLPPLPANFRDFQDSQDNMMDEDGFYQVDVHRMGR